MNLTLADQYYLKALDNYPYNLEFAIENLNYALGYDDEHAPSNCLLGKVYMYQIKDYKKAGQCFYNALVADVNYPDTYKYYSLLRMWEGEYDRAWKIILRGLRVKGMDKSVLYLHKATILEWKMELKEAKAVLKQAKLYSVDPCRISKIDQDLARIKQKLKAIKAKKKA